MGGAGIRHWQDFCRRHRIALSDFILNIGDADENNTFHRRILGSYDDSKLLNTFSGIEYNDISGFLSKYPTIRRVYITRSIATQPWRTIIEKLMVTNEKLMVQPLLTPSANARFSYGLARKKHITGAATLEDYIFECWREVWYKD